jgi:hypothetical protein
LRTVGRHMRPETALIDAGECPPEQLTPGAVGSSMPHGDSDIQRTDQSLSEAMQNRGKRPCQIAGAQQNDPLFCLAIRVE